MKQVLLAIALASCRNSGTSASPPGSTPGSAVVADAGAGGGPHDATPSKGWVGVIAASQLVDVAPQVSGVIAKVMVRAGDAVKAGDVVAEMDPSSMQDQLRAAQAAVAAAQAAFAQAVVDVQDGNRKLKLETEAVKDGVSPRQNVEEARFNVKRAEAAAEHASATVAAERARLDSARTHVANTSLKATFEGIVSNRYHDDGNTVQAGEPVVRIVRQEGLRLKFAVPADHARTLAVGGHIVATVDTIATPVPAIIRQIAPALDPASQLIFVEAEPTSPLAAGLRPGLAAWVRTP